MLNTIKQRFYSLPLYVLVLGLVLLPLVFSTATLDYTLAPRFTYLGVLVILMSVSQMLIKQSSLSLFKYIAPFVVFILMEVFSLFDATSPGEGLVVILKDSGLLVFLILLVQVCQKDGAVTAISKAVVIVNAIIGSYGMYQLFLTDALMDETRLYELISLLGHRNLFASALVITLPFLVFMSWQSRGVWRWMSLVFFAHSSFLIFVLESRTAWLAYFVFVISYPLWLLLEKLVSRIRIEVWRGLYVSILTLSLAIFSWTYFTKNNEPQRAQELKSELGLSPENQGNFTIDERVMLWKGTLRMVWSEDFAGVGAGNWKIMFPAYGSDIWRARQGMVQFQRPHNDYLWVLSETGVLGLLAYLSGFILIGFYALRASSSHHLELGQRVLIRVLLSGVLAYLLVACFSFPRERTFHQLVLYTMLGILVYLSRPSISKRTFASIFINALSIILGLLITWGGISWWQGEVIIMKVNKARAKGDWEGLLQEYSKVEQNRFYKIDAVSVPLSFYSGLAYLNLQEFPKSEEEFTKAYKLHPNNIHVINNMANICYLQGKTDSAIVFYKKALEVSPKYMDGALNLMAAYYNSKQIDEAYQVLGFYEDIFRIEEPNHPSLKMYRTAILKAQKTRMIEDVEGETVRLYLESLDDAQLEELHFEALKQQISLDEMIHKSAQNQL